MVKKTSSEPFIAPSATIGLVGHVDHGKTTLTERLSGKWTDTHSEELKRGITIRLGYADTVICEDASLPSPDRFTTEQKHPRSGQVTSLVRKVSFVDAPGHESLMATMLAGTSIMDGALLMVAANEHCPQPQTAEHLKALEIIGLKNVIVVQNKIDLVDEERATQNYEQIRAFLKGTAYENAPVIPVSAAHNANIDLLLAAIEEVIPTPVRDANAAPLFFVARSFDINKPGVTPAKLKGGVLGGAVKQGVFHVGDVIEIRPGRFVEEANQKVAHPLKTTITSLVTGSQPVEEIRPGGSQGIMTQLDPAVVKADALTGSVVGKPGTLPPTRYDLTLIITLLDRVVGSSEELRVEPIKLGEPLLLNVQAAATVGMVTELGKDKATDKTKVKMKLKLPVCAENGARVTISRRVGTRFRLVGYGIIQ
jgi:translation initiation factor 2 subunit 3